MEDNGAKKNRASPGIAFRIRHGFRLDLLIYNGFNWEFDTFGYIPAHTTARDQQRRKYPLSQIRKFIKQL